MKFRKLTQKEKESIGLIGNIASIFSALPLVVQILTSVVFAGATIFLYIRFLGQLTLDILIRIIQSQVWQTQIILKLWQVLSLVIAITLIYFYSKKLIRKYRFKKSLIKFENYNWRTVKDIFDRYHIDRFPYCIKHNKQIVWTEDTTRYCRCPECENAYTSEDIYKLFPELQKYVRKELKLFYLPELNYGTIDYDKINKFIDRRIENIKNK